MNREIFIGYDPREIDAYEVAAKSIVMQWSDLAIPKPIILNEMRRVGLYRRQHIQEQVEGRIVNFDLISGAPMSTEFAISRFLTPHLATGQWALFIDCDVMARCDLNALFALANPAYAVQVVKHMTPIASAGARGTKMDGQIQTTYPCKNWSSVMLFNCHHPSNQRLTLDLINSAPGRDLHRFCWLDPSEIGALPAQFNHLVGVDWPNPSASLVHFTLGIPRMAGYHDCEFSSEWFSWLARLP